MGCFTFFKCKIRKKCDAEYNCKELDLNTPWSKPFVYCMNMCNECVLNVKLHFSKFFYANFSKLFQSSFFNTVSWFVFPGKFQKNYSLIWHKNSKHEKVIWIKIWHYVQTIFLPTSIRTSTPFQSYLVFTSLKNQLNIMDTNTNVSEKLIRPLY